MQFSLTLDMFESNSLTLWLDYFRMIIERPVPSEVDTIDREDRERTVWWKCKKWACAIVERIFDRYFYD